ncbi:MAG: mechanosensitive ion channel [Rhodospirillaceae bacterium]|nr:mechanosensitive ion channel [Rhodospirillaceae bacterium]
MSLRAFLSILVAIVLLGANGPAPAQETSRPFSKIVDDWERTLDNAQRYVADPVHFEERNREYRILLGEVRAAAQQAVSKATARIEQQQRLLDALGPAPKEGDPPEQPGIAEQREKYAEDIAFYRARVSQAELATARADALIAAISDLSRAQLLQDLSTANSSPLAPATVSRALPDLYQASVTLARTPVDWWEDLSAELRSSVLFFRIPAFLVVAFLVGWGIRYVAVRFLGRDPEVADPTYARRLVGAVADAVSRGIFPAMILTVILVRITSEGAVITGPFAIVLAAICKALILFVLAWALPRAALAPDQPQWRLTVLTPLGAQALSHRITILAALVSVSYFVAEVLLALTERILPETQIDAGLQHSLSAGFGYVGIVIAAMLGVSAVGLDLTNIALIAGALSVGIGFGLQNIVNNFVSGITLLIERPIKVGDWVVVGDQEGIVKRIQVRATEIETFQRTSVIVPNSAFLQEPVINRTHKDSFGRVEVPVGVAYGSDTAKVEQILLDAAKANPKVASWPEPFVLFLNFGNSSLDFELRCYCPNVFDTFRTGSELRFAIDRAFRRAGIEIPFPQHDVHLKDLDRLGQLFAAKRNDSAD